MPRYETSGGPVLLFISDLLLLCGCFYGAAVLDLRYDAASYFLREGGIRRVAVVIATVLLGLYFDQLYAEIRVRSRILLLQKLCEVFGLSLIAQSLLSYANRAWGLSHWLMLYGSGFSLLTLFAWRIVYSRTLLNVIGRQRIVFLGNNKTVQEIAREMEGRPERGFEVLGFAAENSPGSLAEIVRESCPDRIVVGLEDRRHSLPTAELLQMKYSGIIIEEASQSCESLLFRVSARDLSPRELIFTRELIPSTNDIWIQRFIDIALSLALLIVLSPVLFLAVLSLRIRSKSPVIVGYTRIGKDGVPFSMLRLRPLPGLGFFYSRFHLDAVPELINVLRGEMSLVGPSPESPETTEDGSRIIALYDYRQNVPPGMTGWAQIKLSRIERRTLPLLSLEFDLYYIKHSSQLLNAYILITTLKNRLIWADLA